VRSEFGKQRVRTVWVVRVVDGEVVQERTAHPTGPREVSPHLVVGDRQQGAHVRRPRVQRLDGPQVASSFDLVDDDAHIRRVGYLRVVFEEKHRIGDLRSLVGVDAKSLTGPNGK
jgi:hypothetical protein